MFGIILNINAQIPTDGLVGYWPFNGNADDASGNGNNGTVYGATLTTDRFGNSNSAYSFNGTNNYINLGVLSGYTSHAFTGWFKINTMVPHAYNALVSKLYNDLYFAKNSEVRIDPYGMCIYKINSQFGDCSIWKSVSDTNNIDSTIWHHFVFQYNDLDKTLKLYLDKILTDSIKVTGYCDVATTPTYVGARPYWNGNTAFYFHGLIDDIRIYNRALTNSEISNLYNENKCVETVYDTIHVTVHDTVHILGQTPVSGIVAYYPFNGNANDESGNGLNGTVNGATLTTDRFGNANSAYNFNGIDNYIEISNSSGLSFKTNPFTVSLWFKTSVINTGDMISKDRNSVAPSEFRISFEGDSLHTELTDTNYYTPGNQGEASLTINSVSYYANLSVWTNIIYTRNLKTIKVFVNGTLLKQKECDIIINQNNDLNFRIGARYNIGSDNSASDFFKGMIDDIRIYNRALTDSEISNLYNENKYVEIIHDTVHMTIKDTIKIPINDTIHVPIKDTIHITVKDTIQVPVNDTIHVTVNDTIHVTVHDTILVSVTDTLIINVKLTGINPPDNYNTIKVYPNPTKDILYINTGSNYSQMTNYKLKITDTKGLVIFESNVNKQLFEINMNDFGNKGLYFIQIIDSSNKIIDTKKLLLE